MKRFLHLALVLLLASCSVLAAGGACPTGANYLNASTGQLVTLSSLGVTSCFYISKQSGASNSNSGTSESSPWLSVPGMSSCSGTCSSTTPAAGEGFILRGCDTWTDSDLPVGWDWSGSSGSPIYIGMDKTWYNTSVCPSNWNRPIWDSGGDTGLYTYFYAAYTAPRSYVILDNIEMVHLGDNSGTYIVGYYGANNVVFSNLYLHALRVTLDECTLVAGMGPSGSISNNLFTNSVIDGSDASGASPAGGTCYAFYTTLPSVTNTIIRGASTSSSSNGLANGIVGYDAQGSPLTFSGNLIYNIIESNNGVHPNCMEFVGGATYYIHDNVFHDCNGETLMFGNTNEVDYIWNNVFWDILGDPLISPQGPSMTGIQHYIWNNTIHNAESSGSCILCDTGFSPSYSTVQIENNHCITPGGGGISTSWPGTTAVLVDNLEQTTTTANGQGYTSSETYVFSPISTCTPGTCSTVQAGTNLSSDCSGSLSGLCSDTAYACSLGTVNGVVQPVCPARTSVARPTSGAWDVGAYQFGDGGQPQPPTGLPSKAY